MYHVVFITKYRRKAIFGQIRSELGEVFRHLAKHKESSIEESRLMPDHVHMMISIPPKYAFSQVIGYIKGKSPIHVARVYSERKRCFAGQTSGHAATSFPQSGTASRQFGNISATKNMKIAESIN
jgi:putative transposase